MEIRTLLSFGLKLLCALGDFSALSKSFEGSSQFVTKPEQNENEIRRGEFNKNNLLKYSHTYTWYYL